MCHGSWYRIIAGYYLQADTSARPSEERLLPLSHFSSPQIKSELSQAPTFHLRRKFGITLLLVQYVIGLAGSMALCPLLHPLCYKMDPLAAITMRKTCSRQPLPF